MSTPGSDSAQRWQQALVVLAVYATAPHALGGIAVRSAPGPIRDSLLEELGTLLDPATIKRVPSTVAESRLIGGIDLTRTLATNTLCWEQGLVNQCHGGTLVLSMAERAERRVIAHLCSCLDRGEILVAREGMTREADAAFGVVALDEGAEEEQPQAALLERLGLAIELDGISVRDLALCPWSAADIADARSRWRSVELGEAALSTIAVASIQLGVHSPRAMLQTAIIARIISALEHEPSVSDEQLHRAIALGMLHRATQLPLPPDAPADPAQEVTEPPAEENKNSAEPEQQQLPPEDQLIETIAATLPKQLLDKLQGRAAARHPPQKSSGKAGAQQRNKQRGRPIGSMPGSPREGYKLNLMATLRACAPWQTLRQPIGEPRKLRIQPSDIRVTRFKQPQETATIFVVDASGSSALHRMAEAKGAIELLLTDCYSRRDSVALIAFKGTEAEVLLPPTRSLVRAKKVLAALPGGGGTPLAHAIELAEQLAATIQRQGITPTTVFFTDGMANIARDGTPGRPQAQADVLIAAKRFQQLTSRTLLIDSSPRASSRARELASALNGNYLAMPHASATGLRDVLLPH
ncbi:MAG: magnesium chelatase subunit D [Proteobacteria bacterium]|nr:magnesium chelatase subunit D [Pseudomonadota bacterium]